MIQAFLLSLHAVCPLLFFTDLTRNPYITQVLLLQAGLSAVLFFRLASGLRQGVLTFRRTAMDGPVLALAAVASASWGLSWLLHPSLRPSIFHEGFRNHFFLVVNGLLPFFFAAQEAGPASDRRFRRTVLAVGAAAGAYGVLQYFGVEWFWPKALNPYNGRPVSTFGNPNFLSSYLVMLLPFALWEFLKARADRLVWGGLIVLTGAAVICTMTRSSWIGALVSAGLFLAASRGEWKERRGKLAVLGGILLAMTLFWPRSPVSPGTEDPFHRVAELVRGVAGKGVYGSWHQRLLIWSCARDMFLERPFLGKGWGCFEMFFPFYQGAYLRDPVFRGFRTHANNAHNVVLEVLSQTGLVGLGVGLWALWTLYALLRRRGPSLPEDRRALAWAKAAALAGMLADNFFGNVSLFFAVPALLFAWTAGSLAADVGEEGVRAVSLRRPAAAAAACFAALLSAGSVVLCFRWWKAEIAYFDGYKRIHDGDLAGGARLLEESRSWRRYEVNNDYELANAYLEQARRGFSQGLTDEPRALMARAVEVFDDAQAANAGYDEVYFNKASALLSLGRTPEAVESLRASILIDPLHEESYKQLANVYVQGGADPAAEVDLFRRAVVYFPRRPDFWNALGHGLFRAGRPAEAAEAFSRALALDVDFKAAESNLRAVLDQARLPAPPILAAPALAADVRDLARKRRFPEALAKAEALASLAPDCPLSWLMAADLRAEKGDFSVALADYDRLLALDPGHRSGRLNKARTLLRLGRRDEARALAEDLLREKADDAEARALLGKL